MRYDMSCFFVYPFLGMLHVFEHDEDVARKYFTRERERGKDVILFSFVMVVYWNV